MKYLIAGLGNIGDEYADTRHNIGFTVLDALAKASNISFSDMRYGAVAEYKFKGRTFVLLKPSTYMNLSGNAVRYWMQKQKIALENILIITDDLNLNFGTLRMRKKGSDGGHNGLAHINRVLGTNSYARLRFGIGNEFLKGKQVDYVLGKWTTEEEEQLKERCEKVQQTVQAFGTIGVDRTMSQFNNK